MRSIPDTADIVELVRNADEHAIHRWLDELDGERDALKTLLRAVQARQRARQTAGNTEGRDD